MGPGETSHGGAPHAGVLASVRASKGKNIMDTKKGAETRLIRHAKRCGVELVFDGGRGPCVVWRPGLVIAQFDADPSDVRAMVHNASRKGSDQ